MLTSHEERNCVEMYGSRHPVDVLETDQPFAEAFIKSDDDLGLEWGYADKKVLGTHSHPV